MAETENPDANPDLSQPKQASISPITIATILCVCGWTLAVFLWNVYATETSLAAKIVAVVSACGIACAATFQPSLRKLAFTAWVIACVVSAFCFPNAFIQWGDFELKTLIRPLIQLIMFGMGATLAIADFTRVLKMPWAVFIGVFLQFVVMPLLGYSLALAFGFESSVAAGLILVGACPGGVASNVMTYLSKGNVALSVTMTACSTLVAPIMTPLLMNLLAGTFIEVDVLKMMIDIFMMIIVPIALGLLTNMVLQAFQWRSAWIDRCLSLIAMAGICFIIGIIIADSRDKLLTIGIALVAAAILHNAAGYIFGYFGAKLANLDESSCRTVSIEVGLQNGGMATALAINTLQDPLAALAPAIFGPWMNISGSTLASWWAARPPKTESESLSKEEKA